MTEHNLSRDYDIAGPWLRMLVWLGLMGMLLLLACPPVVV